MRSSREKDKIDELDEPVPESWERPTKPDPEPVGDVAPVEQELVTVYAFARVLGPLGEAFVTEQRLSGDGPVKRSTRDWQHLYDAWLRAPR